MEARQKNINSGDMFSFPNTPTTQDPDSDFEFGCLTPDSPYKNSPADHLFFNGKLLPHSFPIIIQPSNSTDVIISRTTSRASSVSSKDSLMSSRSNSTNSRTSSCSGSARTSSSDSSERMRILYQSKVGAPAPATRDRYQVYGASQRWQFITPAPAVLSRESSRRKKGDVAAKVEGKEKVKGRESSGICLTFFRLFLSACRECHAMEPSKNDELQKI